MISVFYHTYQKWHYTKVSKIKYHVFSHSDYKVSFKLQADIQKAVKGNNVQLLKTLLQHESINFGVIDDAAASIFMTTLKTMMTDNSGANFKLNTIVTAVESKNKKCYRIV